MVTAFAGPLRMRYQHRVVGMLSLLAVITYLDRVCTAVAGPQMQDSLGITPQAWGWRYQRILFFLTLHSKSLPAHSATGLVRGAF